MDSLYEKIHKDERHDQLMLLSRQPITERNFNEWSMGFVDVDRQGSRLEGFRELFASKSSFLDLKGDAKLVGKLIDGFQDGRWRQGIG